MDTADHLDLLDISPKPNSSTKLPAGEEIILTTNQQEALDLQLSWLTLKTGRPFVFSGFAGTGKSTTLGKLVEAIKEKFPFYEIGMTAPTHKAVKVLRKSAFPGVDYRTLHSMLALKEQIDHMTGEVTYAPDKFQKEPPPITTLDVLIVDEVSMLTDELFNYLVPYIKKGLCVIFTGDRAQIPPVKHKDCIPFLKADAWGMQQYSLTEIMRQKNGNPILEFATEIRNNQQTGIFQPKELLLENGDGIKLIGHASQEEQELLEKYFSDTRFTADSDFMKMIAWRNVTVNYYNTSIRNILYKTAEHINDIMLGERLLMDRPYVITTRNILTKNEEIEVKSLSTVLKAVEWRDQFGGSQSRTFKFYNAGVEYTTEGKLKTATLLIIHEESKSDYLNLIEKLRKDALNSPPTVRGKMWSYYFKCIETSAWVKYNYAVTGHNSQGSTYDNVLVLKWDIDYNKNVEERNRILYVACTRARNTLFIEV